MRLNPFKARLVKAGLAAMVAAALSTGCATTKAPYDYTQFKQSRPSSILVLPPLNGSPDINATYSMLSQVTLPLAESGYYVFPVSLVDETFHQNGLNNPAEMHEVKLQKLREIFGADAWPEGALVLIAIRQQAGFATVRGHQSGFVGVGEGHPEVIVGDALCFAEGLLVDERFDDVPRDVERRADDEHHGAAEEHAVFDGERKSRPT